MAFTITGVDPAQHPALADIEKLTGPSNFFRLLAHRPEPMRHVAALYQSVMGPGTVDLRLKEMIYVAVSAVNECEYCMNHHVGEARRTGLTDHDLKDLRSETGQNFSDRERTAVEYARELAREASTDGDLRNRLERLFSADQIVEITLVAALANFTNRISNGLEVPLEDRKHLAV